MSSIQEIFEEFCNKYRFKLSPNNKFKAKIITPFGGLDNDPISFIVEQVDEETLILNDGLSIYRFYDKNFYDPSDNALDIAKSILKQYETNNDEFKFVKTIKLSSDIWREEILDYITALIRLQDLTFFKRETIIKEFLEIVREFIKDNVKAEYRYFSQGIERFDPDNLYPVDVALSNDNINFINIYAISSHPKLTESALSMMYYRYEAKEGRFFNITIFDELSKFAKSNKLKRLYSLSDKQLIEFGDIEKKVLLEEIDKHLKNGKVIERK